jgi:hypothetical protein
VRGIQKTFRTHFAHKLTRKPFLERPENQLSAEMLRILRGWRISRDAVSHTAPNMVSSGVKVVSNLSRNHSFLRIYRERATGIEPAFQSLPLDDTLSRGKMNVAEYS